MSTTPQPLIHESVEAAHKLIAPYIRHTPVLSSTSLSGLASSSDLVLTLYFKPECLQKSGSFKIRGATHALLRLPQSALASGCGVTTHSSGNHAAALALAARTLGRSTGNPGPIIYPIPAYIIMPNISSPGKIASVRGYGGQITFSGSTHPERAAVLAEVQQRTNAIFIPPYDHPDIIVGQGTAALELIQDLSPNGLDVIVAPVGGGGLLAGTALAAYGSGIQVYGAEPSEGGADDCARGLKAGERIPFVSTLTIADGLRTPVGEHNWKIISDQQYVKGVYAVSEEEIKKAMKLGMERLKVVIEPSSAVPLAALMFNAEFRQRLVQEFPNHAGPIRAGIVISGGNITLEKVAELFASED
ncbi:tryptophan synthase beta subunit-like PLP-dependent enzyme [Pluteus cervinus]|uniref:Tryptophan synthase beta subunit-like PLP-dependent enzyme n=1 Tax=Pluteus cervinus TaxID=181527 RepID=A0ACD3B6T5_9AGAR|nr:tryptophan synthase beta subunit-like PLP-dependent enzyme [Pluteus cervinus]